MEAYDMPWNLIREALWLSKRKPHGAQQITFDPDSERTFKIRKRDRTANSMPLADTERPIAEFEDGRQTKKWSWKK